MTTKLSDKQLEALEQVAKGRTSYTAKWATIQALKDKDLIEFRNDPRWPHWPSGGRYHITDAGRAALAQGDGHD